MVSNTEISPEQPDGENGGEPTPVRPVFAVRYGQLGFVGEFSILLARTLPRVGSLRCLGARAASERGLGHSGKDQELSEEPIPLRFGALLV